MTDEPSPIVQILPGVYNVCRLLEFAYTFLAEPIMESIYVLESYAEQMREAVSASMGLSTNDQVLSLGEPDSPRKKLYDDSMAVATTLVKFIEEIKDDWKHSEEASQIEFRTWRKVARGWAGITEAIRDWELGRIDGVVVSISVQGKDRVQQFCQSINHLHAHVTLYTRSLLRCVSCKVYLGEGRRYRI